MIQFWSLFKPQTSNGMICLCKQLKSFHFRQCECDAPWDSIHFVKNAQSLWFQLISVEINYFHHSLFNVIFSFACARNALICIAWMSLCRFTFELNSFSYKFKYVRALFQISVAKVSILFRIIILFTGRCQAYFELPQNYHKNNDN